MFSRTTNNETYIRNLFSSFNGTIQQYNHVRIERKNLNQDHKTHTDVVALHGRPQINCGFVTTCYEVIFRTHESLLVC